MELLTVARNVGIFNRQTQAYITEAFRNVNISFSECIILMNVYDNEGITQEALSSLLYIDKAATARAIKSLEKKGFMIREMKQEDRRAKKLYLTDKARGHKEYFYQLLKNWEIQATKGMDEPIKDLLFKGIQMLADNSTKAGNQNGAESEAD